jgi:Short C-terminal domain
LRLPHSARFGSRGEARTTPSWHATPLLAGCRAGRLGAPAAEPDYTQELEKLADLRDKGLISDIDFEAKKEQILGL